MKKVLLALLVLFLLAFAAMLYVDSKIRGLAERRAEERISAVVPGAEGVHVEIDGALFVLGVLVTEEVDALHLKVDRVRYGTLEAHDISLDVDTIAIDRSALIGDQRLVVTEIGSATAHASITDNQVSEVVKRTVRFAPNKVWVTVKGHEIPVKPEVSDRKVVMRSGIPGAPTLTFPLPPENVLPCTPALELSEGFIELSCTIDELPRQLKDAMAKP